jgi:fructose-1-phosphate kinase PfkB-like protein
MLVNSIVANAIKYLLLPGVARLATSRREARAWVGGVNVSNILFAPGFPVVAVGPLAQPGKTLIQVNLTATTATVGGVNESVILVNTRSNQGVAKTFTRVHANDVGSTPAWFSATGRPSG